MSHDYVAVLKGNPYHDKTGAFTSKAKASGGGDTVSSGQRKPKEFRSMVVESSPKGDGYVVWDKGTWQDYQRSKGTDREWSPWQLKRVVPTLDEAERQAELWQREADAYDRPVTIEDSARALGINPKGKTEGIGAATEAVSTTITSATPSGGPFRSKIVPTKENEEARGKLASYMEGYHKQLKNEQERAYVQERVRQMLNGEDRPKGMSGKFGLEKRRAIEYEALTFKIFRAGRKKIGL